MGDFGKLLSVVTRRGFFSLAYTNPRLKLRKALLRYFCSKEGLMLESPLHNYGCETRKWGSIIVPKVLKLIAIIIFLECAGFQNMNRKKLNGRVPVLISRFQIDIRFGWICPNLCKHLPSYIYVGCIQIQINNMLKYVSSIIGVYFLGNLVQTIGRVFCIPLSK
jgi:hypothetical protein